MTHFYLVYCCSKAAAVAGFAALGWYSYHQQEGHQHQQQTSSTDSTSVARGTAELCSTVIYQAPPPDYATVSADSVVDTQCRCPENGVLQPAVLLTPLPHLHCCLLFATTPSASPYSGPPAECLQHRLHGQPTCQHTCCCGGRPAHHPCHLHGHRQRSASSQQLGHPSLTQAAASGGAAALLVAHLLPHTCSLSSCWQLLRQCCWVLSCTLCSPAQRLGGSSRSSNR